MTPGDWHADLDALADGLARRHRDPFRTVPRERFFAAVAGLHDRIPRLTDAAVMVGFDALAAMIGDGHTLVETDGHYRQLPLEVFWYADELRVVRTLTADPRVCGARMLAIGGVAIDEVHRRLQLVIAQDENAWYVLARSADRLTRADVLAALDLPCGAPTVRFTLAGPDGTDFAVDIAALPPGTAPDWPEPAPDAPLRSRHPDEALAYSALPDTDAAYVNFRRYDGIETAGARVVARLRDEAPGRLILDLRDNGGGDYTLARDHLIYPLWAVPNINRPGGLYVLIGRRTFSAAMVTATDFRRETEAVLVGEPTGARPVGYQELGTFELPRSGLRAHCATRRYRFSDVDRPAVFPDQRVDPDWEVESSDRDPAVEWCLAQGQ